MQREDLKDLSREQLERLICDWALKYYDLEGERIRVTGERGALIDERNNLLKNSKSYDFAKLQDQHQQDFIRYNDMWTAYLVTLDELARLREQFGIG